MWLLWYPNSDSFRRDNLDNQRSFSTEMGVKLVKMRLETTHGIYFSEDQETLSRHVIKFTGDELVCNELAADPISNELGQASNMDDTVLWSSWKPRRVEMPLWKWMVGTCSTLKVPKKPSFPTSFHGNPSTHLLNPENPWSAGVPAKGSRATRRRCITPWRLAQWGTGQAARSFDVEEFGFVWGN